MAGGKTLRLPLRLCEIQLSLQCCQELCEASAYLPLPAPLSPCYSSLERCGGPAEGRQHPNHPSVACTLGEFHGDPRLLHLQPVVPVPLLYLASDCTSFPPIFSGLCHLV